LNNKNNVTKRLNATLAKHLTAVVVAGLLGGLPQVYAQTDPPPAAQVAAKPDAADPAPAPTVTPIPLARYLEPLLRTDRRLAAANEDLEAGNQRAKAALGDWFPTLKVTAWGGGKERIDNPTGTADTSLKPKETDLTLTQLITDFGKTDAKVMKARIAAQQGEVGYQTIKQTLINDAATAYANLYRASIQLRYAVQSEANLTNQLQLEQQRLNAGGGVATDVLQVQAQLAGAQARRNRAQVQVQNGNSRFFNLFGVAVMNMDTLVAPVFPGGLPTSIEGAFKQAQESNLTIKNALLSSESARQSIRGDRAESYFPKFELIYDYKDKNNVSGSAGLKNEQLLKAQMSWSFNLGFAGTNTVKAAEHSLAAAEYRKIDAEKNAREQVAIAWQTLVSSRQTALVFANQVAALARFLELARKERALGSRTLLDVLNGETSLLNAQSDAISAEIDVLLSGYAVLQSVGQLSEAAVSPSK